MESALKKNKARRGQDVLGVLGNIDKGGQIALLHLGNRVYGRGSPFLCVAGAQASGLTGAAAPAS